MSRAFADISFTPSVKAAQSRYGSREANRGFEQVEEKRDFLEQRDADFIMARDSFYQATISENGWPYVQHRGGPVGFLKVIDEKTMGYADFSGNAQYLSVGNLNATSRISIILMDYPNRRRLKIWGSAKIVHEHEQPELIAQLEMGHYRARIERAVIITVEAIEWNCPQHITQRFSAQEVQEQVQEQMAAVLEQNRLLKQELAELQQQTPAASPAVKAQSMGNGPLELCITGVRKLTSRVRAFELRRPDGSALPKVEAGAHLRVPVVLADGQSATRQYSISSNPARRDIYEIAVLREADGRGGSIAVHDLFELGMRLHCDQPRNDFALHTSTAPSILIAGGIGITPIKAMAQQLKAQARTLILHYAGRSINQMAYRDRLQRELGQNMQVYPGDQGTRLDLDQLMQEAPADALFYVCGPENLIAAVLASAKAAGIDQQRLRYERFVALHSAQDQEIRVELRRSKKVIMVKHDQSVLDAVRAAGVPAFAECEVGNCGTCTVKVLGGEPEHRDAVLSDEEKKHAMCICVSRAKSQELVLDL
ncbi:MAG: pyridoxamine 5'-phosphate oxidase family protein [Burkholderiales bacterium]|nr:pyridoxamine 5'-phosphate oxidase family protein [Burkholderiales bacterium]